MSTNALGEYKFESASRQELYGDDMMVHVERRDSRFLVTPVSFRVPTAMTWDDFVATQVMPVMKSDPDFDEGKAITWELVKQPFTPEGSKSLAENGIKHKNVLSLIGA